MNSEKETLIADIKNFQDDAIEFFEKCDELIDKGDETAWRKYNTDYWYQITPKLQEVAEALIAKIVHIGKKMIFLSSKSALVDDADQAEIPKIIKTIRASLTFKRYQYSDPDLLHDEGTVLGFKPASQHESTGLAPAASKRILSESLDKLVRTLQLVDQDLYLESFQSIKTTSEQVSKHKANTAFIMMWMDENNPELTDIHGAVKETFAKFDIDAVRADDIEHEGMITNRIIDEIKRSEFLFADLTGARPNVYYETGFAHALGKRVILFRKKGSGLHFDLAGYNCPEYINITDLKEKLQKRLVSLTNKEIK